MKCISLITISILMIHSCKTIETYNQADSPKFHNNSIIDNSPHNNLLKVISFNIKNGTDPKYVITELNNSNEFSDPNILLLQEVDEETVIQIADSFHLNYLYYPIACSNKNLNFGNAILSNSTITEASKLILPHSKSNGRIRNATNGVVEFKGHKILVYSIHNETIVMGAKKRLEQLEFIFEDIKKRSDQYHAIIVGGDFNTITQKSQNYLIKNLIN